MLGASDQQLPVFDLGTYGVASAAERRVLAGAVDDALGTMGFLLVVGHGIEASAIDEVRVTAKSFFDLELDVKMGYLPAVHGAPGFYPVRAGSLARTMGLKRSPDLKESFTVGPVDRPPAEYSRQVEAGRWFPPHRWPDVEGMRESWTQLYRQASGVARRLLEVFEVSLDLPAATFGDRCRNATSTLSAIHYPPQPPSHCDRMRAGPHSDYGTFTMLQKAPGSDRLEILRDDGEWIAVTAPPGGLIVNIGDLMTRWVADRWISRVHRVVGPSPGASDGRGGSISIGFFHQPDFDASVQAPGAPERASRRPETIRAGDYLAAKMRRQHESTTV